MSWSSAQVGCGWSSTEALLDDVDPAGSPGWLAAVDHLDGRCAVILCADHNLDLTRDDTGPQPLGGGLNGSTHHQF